MSEFVKTEEMITAENLIDQGKNVFITGKAGSGKTTFLKSLSKKYAEQCIIVAPTGVAAINAGGATIHSMFSLPIGFIDPTKPLEYKLGNDKKRAIKNADLLIIDEISMVRCDTMDAIDKRLKSARRSKKPFGGMQVVMFGDLMQLPPVVTDEEGSVLTEYYDNFFFFNANIFKQSELHMVELDEIFRQRDERFINVLNSVREGEYTPEISDAVSEMLNRKLSEDDAVHLCAVRSVADAYNERKLGQYTHIFKANIDGEFNPKSAICDLSLKLREGARVMITKNGENYVNGTLGYVKKINNDNITIMTDDGYRVMVEPHTWESYRYDIKNVVEGDCIKVVIDKIPTGSCTQFPLTLAYAITIHKSQGLTFDKVVLHIRDIFQTGQLYTALSRCRKIENVSIDYEITNKMLNKNITIGNFIDTVKQNNGVYTLKDC